MEDDKPSEEETEQFTGAEEYKNLEKVENQVAEPVEYRVHDKAPKLTAVQTEVLQKQWDRFWELRSKEVPNTPDTDIPEGTLIHQMRYSPDALRRILGSGILSGELSFGDREPVIEDAETHYCADFFVNEEPKTVEEFIQFASEQIVSDGGVRYGRMERFGLPRERSSNLSLVIDSRNPDLQELLSNSATVAELPTSTLNEFPIEFPRAETGEDRHRAVLVGVPANFIKEIIVGGRISGDPEALSEIKTMIAEAGLDIKLVDIKGIQL